MILVRRHNASQSFFGSMLFCAGVSDESKTFVHQAVSEDLCLLGPNWYQPLPSARPRNAPTHEFKDWHPEIVNSE